MKKKILLLDESLTVQKVVALTLDRERFAIMNAKSRSEAMKMVLDSPPDILLVSDQVAGVAAVHFPKEVEAWAGRDRVAPALILITAADISEQRGYAAVLKKPFAPQALQNAVNEALPGETGHRSDEVEELRMQKVFNEAFSDEAKLVSETFESEIEESEATLLTIPVPSSKGSRKPPPAVESVAGLWGKASDAESHPQEVLSPGESAAYKGELEKQVTLQLEKYDLEDVVHRILQKVVPPIVERLATERLDQLLKDNESFVELKP
jgi:DNA-binding response OmpR family regulator